MDLPLQGFLNSAVQRREENWGRKASKMRLLHGFQNIHTSQQACVPCRNYTCYINTLESTACTFRMCHCHGQRGYTLTFWMLKLSKALDVLLFVICIANRLLYIYVSWTYYLPLTFMYVKGKFSLPERASMWPARSWPQIWQTCF